MTTVEIFGRRYNIKGDDNPETIRALARYVDRRMRRLAQRVEPGDALRVAVLTALNIAHDYYQQRRALEQQEEEIETQVDTLAAELQRAFEIADREDRTEERVDEP